MIPIPWSLIGNLLFKAAPYLIAASVAGWGIWSVYSWDQDRLNASYKRGYDAHQAVINRQIIKRVKEEKARRELDKKHLFEVLDAKEKRNQELLDTIAANSNKRMFVSVKRKPTACDRSGMPGGGDTGLNAGETERAELSAEAQRDIQRLGINADQLVNQYLTLVGLIERSQGECLKIVD